MSTIDDPEAEAMPVPGSPEDPFRHGWRYRPVKQPDGRVEVEQIPLTLEDLLFPEEGDQTPQFPSHTDCPRGRGRGEVAGRLGGEGRAGGPAPRDGGGEPAAPGRGLIARPEALPGRPAPA